MARKRRKWARRLELSAYRLRLRLSWEHALAGLNLRFISRLGMNELNAAGESRRDVQSLALQVVLAMFHHHGAASIQLLTAGFGYDAAVCARSALESMILFVHLSHDRDAAVRWFESGRAPSPASVRRKVALPEAFSKVYAQLCDYTHPNLGGALTFLRVTGETTFEIDLGPHPAAYPVGLLRVVIGCCDEVYAHLYHHAKPEHPGILQWLRGKNATQRLLPLPLPAVTQLPTAGN